MSASTGPTLPDAVLAGLSGIGAPEDQASLLVTVDPDGMPRVSMLSRGELEVLGPDSLAVALWSGSSTAGNLDRTGQAALYRIDEGVARSIRLRRRGDRQEFVTESGLRLAGFRCLVVDVLADEVAYATITGMVTFALAEPEPVLARWAAVNEQLRKRFAS